MKHFTLDLHVGSLDHDVWWPLGDLARRDTLLDELLALARTYSDDAAVREVLALPKPKSQTTTP